MATIPASRVGLFSPGAKVTTWVKPVTASASLSRVSSPPALADVSS
ncbi:MAG: hypothetical protein IPN94_24750 [Sphingobacteriales bacterium]|nr:hypothetical protein [Sphingobacteriales bacterium]